MTLAESTTERDEPTELLGGLDSIGEGDEAKFMRQRDDRVAARARVKLAAPLPNALAIAARAPFPPMRNTALPARRLRRGLTEEATSLSRPRAGRDPGNRRSRRA
jgi:hypothetical protein